MCSNVTFLAFECVSVTEIVGSLVLFDHFFNFQKGRSSLLESKNNLQSGLEEFFAFNKVLLPVL